MFLLFQLIHCVNFISITIMEDIYDISQCGVDSHCTLCVGDVGLLL